MSEQEQSSITYLRPDRLYRVEGGWAGFTDARRRAGDTKERQVTLTGVGDRDSKWILTFTETAVDRSKNGKIGAVIGEFCDGFSKNPRKVRVAEDGRTGGCFMVALSK